MIELGLVDGNLIDELMELTAQSLADLEIQEHFNIIKEIGRGKYGKVLLVTHRFRGNTLFFSLHPRYVFLDRLEALFPLKKKASKNEMYFLHPSFITAGCV